MNILLGLAVYEGSFIGQKPIKLIFNRTQNRIEWSWQTIRNPFHHYGHMERFENKKKNSENVNIISTVQFIFFILYFFNYIYDGDRSRSIYSYNSISARHQKMHITLKYPTDI